MRTPQMVMIFGLSLFVGRSLGTPTPTPGSANATDVEGGGGGTRNVSASAGPGDADGGRKFGGCTRPLEERREWRTLSTDEKGDYISAVKCLQANPALNPAMPEARTRFDEFQAHHVVIADAVHNLGQFLPWHRRYIRLYERALREECGYSGTFPYWDWTQDVGPGQNFSNAPVFDPHTGFGGNGLPGTYTLPPSINTTSNRIFPSSFLGCLADGPFSSYTLSIGPGKLATRHCITRGLDDAVGGRYLSREEVGRVSAASGYEVFRVQMEGMPVTEDHRPHDGGHDAIGGEMSNFYSSPGEPLFYLHHSNLDRIWWHWQQKAPSNLYEMTGPSTKTGPYVSVTLSYVLEMGSLGPSVPIRDVMNIHQEPNCYTYV